MTIGDGIVVLICLAAGYWLVSKLLAKLEEPKSIVPAKEVGTTQQQTPPGYEPVTRSNWYRILEVSEYASRDEVSTAYRRMISQYHPDKVSQMGEDIRAVADAKSQQINAAYKFGMQLFY